MIEKIEANNFNKIQFNNKIIEDKFNYVYIPFLKDIYLNRVNDKVVSFALIWEENEELWFMYNHLKSGSDKYYFMKKYSILNKKTVYVNYLYTDEKYRNRYYASSLLHYVEKDLKKDDYWFIWLIKETSSKIYYNLGYNNYIDMLDKLWIKDKFLKDYKSMYKKDIYDILYWFGSTRLVKKV